MVEKTRKIVVCAGLAPHGARNSHRYFTIENWNQPGEALGDSISFAKSIGSGFKSARADTLGALFAIYCTDDSKWICADPADFPAAEDGRMRRHCGGAMYDEICARTGETRAAAKWAAVARKADRAAAEELKARRAVWLAPLREAYHHATTEGARAVLLAELIEAVTAPPSAGEREMYRARALNGGRR